VANLKEKLIQNRNKRITLEETARLLAETEHKLQQEKLERQEADRKLQEEQDRQITFIEKVVSEVLKRVPKPKDGISPDLNEIVVRAVAQMPKPKDGRDGKDLDFDAVVREVMYLIPKPKDGKQGANGSPDTPLDIASKLNTTEESVEMKVIKGLEKKFKNLVVGKGKKGGSGDVIHMEDLTSQTNGITKVFTVPAHRKALMVICSDFPTILLSGNGFTTSGTTLTLTPTNAPSSGAQLAFQYV